MFGEQGPDTALIPQVSFLLGCFICLYLSSACVVLASWCLLIVLYLVSSPPSISSTLTSVLHSATYLYLFLLDLVSGANLDRQEVHTPSQPHIPTPLSQSRYYWLRSEADSQRDIRSQHTSCYLLHTISYALWRVLWPFAKWVVVLASAGD